MAPSYGSLIKEAIALIDHFNGRTQCLDDFIEEVSRDLQVEYMQSQLSSILFGAFDYQFLLSENGCITQELHTGCCIWMC